MECLRPSAGERLLDQAQGVVSHPAVMWEISRLLGMSDPNMGSAAIKGNVFMPFVVTAEICFSAW